MAKIEATMKEEGYDTWVNLFNSKMGGHLDAWGMPERPVLLAWIPQNTVSEPVQVMERNPYYFMIDTAGNQLPYIDRMERVLTEDKEALLLKTIAGDFDYNSCFDWGCFPNHQLVVDSMERGGYRIEQHWWPPDNQGNVRFNFHHEDPVLNALLNDKRFRVAFSLAINREEANSLVFKGTCHADPHRAPRGSSVSRREPVQEPSGFRSGPGQRAARRDRHDLGPRRRRLSRCARTASGCAW